MATPRDELFTPDEQRPRCGPIAGVALAVPVDRLYSYTVPPELAPRVRPGVRVEVPVGAKARRTVGFCIDVNEGEWSSRLRPIEAVLDDEPLLSAELLQLGQWIGRYYCCSTGLALEAMVPAPVKERAGIVRRRYARLPDAQPEASDRKPGPKQQRIIELLQKAAAPLPVDELRRQADCTDAPIRTAARRGLVELFERSEPTETLPDVGRIVDPDFQLNTDQTRAIERAHAVIASGAFRALLLFGVTGSGKTEVYVHAIRAVLAAGKQAVLLVPEIALTTQTVYRLAKRFERVCLLHSGLTATQRAASWRQIAAGQIGLVIGTRSAVFAPCKDLGLIVVDEEQEPSYKNIQVPRYHTRDVALKRGQLESVPVIVGSATPSLETWLNAERADHYERITLPQRVRELPLPHVTLVDMRAESAARKGIHLLSRQLEAQIARALDADQQVILLLNRRGYANYLFCPSCQAVITCPQCKVNMTFHKTTGQAQCHHCSARFAVPAHCPHCSGRHRLVRFGMGTQRVEEELASKFPQARVARVDSDTMQKFTQYQQIIGDFEANRIHIIIGTQMIAKGLDFPFVSLVGVVNADTALAIPDFRAAERTFQLITQVAGRAGRGDVPGEVIVQSLNCDQPSVQAAMRQDYPRFAREELLLRRKVMLPPWGRLTRITLSDARQSRCREQAGLLAQNVRRLIERTGSKVQCIGPQTSPIERLRNQYRFDVLLLAPSAPAMQALLAALRDENLLRPRVRGIAIDVDPVALL